MAKRLAITIAGAVSLGSYEAGVLYELLRAIRTRNEEATSEDEKIYIDVITGASAGGMTAAMLAQRLMYDAASLDGQFQNALYHAWVERISLLALARMGWKEKKWHSLFSSDLIHTIGQEMLVKGMEGKLSGSHPAVEQINGVPQKLRVGLALTNLNGIDYMLPIVGNDDGGFNYTTSIAQKIFDVLPDGKSDFAKWKKMCVAAVGSGAFPAAFRPQAIQSEVGEFGDRVPTDPSKFEQGKTYVQWSGKSPASFANSDGGILQNQPLGIAKNLVDDSVKERGAEAFCDGHNRLYVFISPHSVKSSTQDLAADHITILGVLKQLMRVYTRQAVFHDWIMAEGVNQDVKLLDTRASQLADVMAQGLLDINALAKASSDLNAMLMPNREQAHLNRLRQQYNIEYNRVLTATNPQTADTFIGAIATLESAAQMDKRDKMKIVAVTADPDTELAGSGLSSFIGFFKESYRQHDYRVGRSKTRTYLKRNDVREILGVTEWPEQKHWQIDLPNPSGVTLPLSKFQIARAAIVPLMIMIFIRPALLLSSLLILICIAYILGSGVHHLAHH